MYKTNNRFCLACFSESEQAYQTARLWNEKNKSKRAVVLKNEDIQKIEDHFILEQKING